MLTVLDFFYQVHKKLESLEKFGPFKKSGLAENLPSPSRQG
jgi:hypothetical protein